MSLSMIGGSWGGRWVERNCRSVVQRGPAVGSCQGRLARSSMERRNFLTELGSSKNRWWIARRVPIAGRDAPLSMRWLRTSVRFQPP